MRDQSLSGTYKCGSKFYTDNRGRVFLHLQRPLDFILTLLLNNPTHWQCTNNGFPGAASQSQTIPRMCRKYNEPLASRQSTQYILQYNASRCDCIRELALSCSSTSKLVCHYLSAQRLWCNSLHLNNVQQLSSRQ